MERAMLLEEVNMDLRIVYHRNDKKESKTLHTKKREQMKQKVAQLEPNEQQTVGNNKRRWTDEIKELPGNI